MAAYLMRHSIEKEHKRQRWCLSHPVDPRSLSAAFLEETEVVPPRDEWKGETPPEPQKMACLPDL